MNQRSYDRNVGRIPALLGHIKRCAAKKQPERVAGFKEELARRIKEMTDDGMKKEVDKLVKDTKAKLAKAT